MDDWLLLLVGVALIVGARLVIHLAPHSTIGQELRRSYGIAPSGERGVRVRRDYLKSAGLAGLVAIGLFLTSLGSGLAADQFPEDSKGNMIGFTYMFIAFVLTAVAILSALIALWKAAFWRVELPDNPDHRQAFADAIDHLVDGVATETERLEYIDVRYSQREIEQIRRSTIKLIERHGGQLPENVREQVKDFTAHIRASALGRVPPS